MIAKPTDFNSTGGETYYGYFADELGSITSLYSESANAIVGKIKGGRSLCLRCNSSAKLI